MMANKIRALDLFSGAGGSSWGARLAGAEIVAGFDANEKAGDAFLENFPESYFYENFLEDLNPRSLRRDLGKIDLILASPECTNHSPAKGKGPRCEKSKETAFQVTRFAKAFKPRWIVVENVTSMRNWSRYDEFIESIANLGYHSREQVLCANHFNVPQSRRRLFVTFDLVQEPSEVVSKRQINKTARDIVDRNGSYAFSNLRTENRAKATLERAERAISEVGKRPFLLVYYGSDKAGGWQGLSRPLRTITTLDRFAFVKLERGKHVMRMLQVSELKAAMGMPKKFSLGETTRRNSIRMIGNAVCPPVMQAVVKNLTKATA